MNRERMTTKELAKHEAYETLGRHISGCESCRAEMKSSKPLTCQTGARLFSNAKKGR